MSKHPDDMSILPSIPMAGQGPGKAGPGPTKGQRGQKEPGGDSPKGPGVPTGDYQPHGGHRRVARHRFLSPAEWNLVADSIGGAADTERHRPVHPSRGWYPTAGMPPGLYRDVVAQRNKYYLLFHAASIARSSLMVLQLLIGAALTSIGAMALKNSIPITVLGAVNTVIAGLIALLHNGGLPDRFRYDMTQFEELEDHIKELLDSGIAPVDMTTDQILAECFDRFREAKATVAANLPVNYNTRATLQLDNGRGPISLPQHLPPAPSPAAPVVPPPQGAMTAFGGEDHQGPKPIQRPAPKPAEGAGGAKSNHT